MQIKSHLAAARKVIWHFRQGGPAQVAKWWGRRDQRALTNDRLTDLFDEAVVSDIVVARAPQRGERPLAGAILDEFSATAWAEAFELRFMESTGWEQQLEGLDLLFVESAWSGNAGAWQYQLTGAGAPSAQLRSLVNACQETGIPTVFWNKEDPVHFEDFIETAKLFDHVFTTDANMVAQYEQALGHARVGVLPFAAADHVHNPIRLRHGHQVRDVAFAGTYFAHKFPERREQMDMLLGGALDASARMEHGLEIFSRFQGGDDRYQFPRDLEKRVIGSLGYQDMLVAYKAYKTFLNVNTVIDSPSMCARRIFEILASGTPVVSADSAAIREFFSPEQVPIARSREEAASIVRALVASPNLRDRMVHLAQRAIWEGHTYRHRAEQMLTMLGHDPVDQTAASVSALLSTNRPRQLDHALSSIAGQEGVDVEVVLITHGFEVDESRLSDEWRERGLTSLRAVSMPASKTLGECLRTAVALAEGEVLTKMDDDDFYGPNYLRDALHALRFSGADLVGKQAHYMHLDGMDATILRFPDKEHRWTDRVMGPTMLGRREIFAEVPFSDLTRGEDTDFLRRVRSSGGKIYSADRYNFVQWRGGAHTWEATDWSLAAVGEVKFFGAVHDNINQVFL